jgi:hypothetical protein
MDIDFTQTISLVSAIGTVMAAFLIYFQIKSFEAWNRKQSSHQILNDFVSGTIEDTLEALESKFSWDVLHDKRTYRDVAGTTQDLTELDQLLRRLLRRFEAICISMDHKIVQESICRDYIFSLLLTIYNATVAFIEDERAKRNEPRNFEFLERYARKWTRTGRS